MTIENIISKLVSYDPKTGALTFREATPDMFQDGQKPKEHLCKIWNAKNAGKPAFAAKHNEGYLYGSVLGHKYLAHRVAWLIAEGAWPAGEVDHVNHDRADNRRANIRDVCRADNSRNLGKASNNPTGVTGVYWFGQTSRWVAKIQVKGRSVHLGYYKKFSDAVAARKSAQVLHGFHINHGEAF